MEDQPHHHEARGTDPRTPHQSHDPSSIDQALYNACTIIEMTRREIYNTLRKYKQEYAKALGDLNNTTKWNNMLKQQLEQAFVTIDVITRENSEYKLKLDEKSHVAGELQELSEGGGGIALKDESGSENLLRARVTELEKKLAEMEEAHGREMEEHKTALINAADQIVDRQMTIDKFERMQEAQATQDKGLFEASDQVSSPKRGRPCEEGEENLQDQPIKKRRQRKTRGPGPVIRII